MDNETPTGQDHQPGWDSWETSMAPPPSDHEIEWWPPQQGSWQQPTTEPAQQGWQPPTAPQHELSWDPAQQEASWQPPQQGSWPYPMGPPPAYPMPRRRKSPWLFVGIAAAFLVAIAIAVPTLLHHPPTSTNDRALPSGKSASSPAGYQSFSDATYHFNISAPSGWREIDPASPGAAAVLNEAEQNNPNLRTALPDVSSLAAEGMKFMAIDPAGTNGFGSNVNVIAHSAVGYSDNDLGHLAGQMSQEYGKLGATLTSSQTTTLAGHKALENSLELPLRTRSGGSITVHEVQYFLGGNDILYVITLSGDSPALATIASTFKIR